MFTYLRGTSAIIIIISNHRHHFERRYHRCNRRRELRGMDVAGAGGKGEVVVELR